MGERKQRNDKKVSVKATMSVRSKDHIYHFAYLCEDTVKDVAERLSVLAIDSHHIINNIRGYFRRDLPYNDSYILGNPEQPNLKVITAGETDVVSIKFKKANYDKICEVAYALDITPSSTASVLIVMALNNKEFMKDYVDSNLYYLNDYKLKKISKFLGI